MYVLWPLQEFGKTKIYLPTQSDLSVLSKEVRGRVQLKAKD